MKFSDTSPFNDIFPIPGSCYRIHIAALLHVKLKQHKNTDGWLYVEGWLGHPQREAIPHSWLESPDGGIIDLYHEMFGTMENDYFGANHMDFDTVMRDILHTKSLPFIQDDDAVYLEAKSRAWERSGS